MSHWGGVEERELDRRNQMRSLTLASKVSQLKSVAVDLEHESYEHNRLLDGLDSDFGGGDTLLKGSLNRLHGVLSAGSKNRKLNLLLIIFPLDIYLEFDNVTKDEIIDEVHIYGTNIDF
ncbi:BET1-like protein [Armadillidium vulgare]|nr:BET1-like protein [Armadillidium vulgare]